MSKQYDQATETVPEAIARIRAAGHDVRECPNCGCLCDPTGANVCVCDAACDVCDSDNQPPRGESR